MDIMTLTNAHDRCSYHREAVERSVACGCFYCEAVYAPTEIKRWIDAEQTALCPKCGIDAVLPDDAAQPLTPEFLKAMYKRWFDEEIES